MRGRVRRDARGGVVAAVRSRIGRCARLLLALAAVGCGGGIEHRLRLDQERGLKVFFLAHLGPDGGLVRVEPAMVLEDGARQSGVPFGGSGLPGEGGAVLIGLEASPLQAALPEVELTADSVALASGSPPAMPRRSELAPGRVEVALALPDDATLERLRFSPGGGDLAREALEGEPATRLRGALVLTLRARVAACSPRSYRPLAPFGASPRPFPSTPQSPGSPIPVGSALFEGDRLVVATEDTLHLIARGRDVGLGDRARSLPRAALTSREIHLTDLLRVPGQPDRVRVLARALIPSEAMRDGYLFTVEVGASSLRLVETATLAGFGSARALAEAPGGGWAALADDGQVLTFDAEGRVVPGPPRIMGANGEAMALVAFDDPRFPWIALFRGEVHVFSSSTGLWAPDLVVESLFTSLFTLLARPASDSAPARAWLGDSDGSLYERIDGRWLQRPLRLPAALLPCGSAPEPGGALRITESIRGLVSDGQVLFVAFAQCGALAAIDPDTGCVSAIPRTSGIAMIDPRNGELLLDRGELVVLTRGGEVWSTRP